MVIMHRPVVCGLLRRAGHLHRRPAGVGTHFFYRIPGCGDGGREGVGVGTVVAPEPAGRYGGNNAGLCARCHKG